MKKTIFDLRLHSHADLNKLDMAIGTGITQCGDHKDLQAMKETLLAYKSLVGQAMKIVEERDSTAWVDKQVNEILGSTSN